MFDDVTDTAFWVAAYRAEESDRPDALFRDPHARMLAGDRGFELAHEVTGSKSFAWAIVVRTRVIDEMVLGAVARGVTTVVNLGAGMDARPYRLTLPSGLRWVEVDAPRMVLLKEERLPAKDARCRLERVPVDLSLASARRDLLRSLTGEVLVLTEGVIGYLENTDVAALARALRETPAVRRWIVDFNSPMLQRSMRRRLRVRRQFKNAPLRFKPGDWERFFADAGWRVESKRFLPIEGARLGRPVRIPAYARLLLAITRQSKEIERMMGYAELVPSAEKASGAASPSHGSSGGMRKSSR